MPTDLLSGLSLNLDLFELLKLALGVYLIWGAITGKGKVMINEFPKCSPEDYKKYMRLFLGVTGPVVIISGVLSIFGIATTMPDDPNQVIAWVLWALGLVLLVGVVVFNIVMTDRKAADAAMREREQARAEQQKAANSNPYVFDSETPADDSKRPDAEKPLEKQFTYKSDETRGENKDPRWY